MARKKQIRFVGYRTKEGELIECREGQHQEVRQRTGYRGKLVPKYDRLRRR